MDTASIAALITAAAALLAGVFNFIRAGKANNITEKANELGWVKELRQDALDTRKEMEALQSQVQTLRRQLATVSAEADHWIAQYQALHRTIWRDSITVDRLRDYVGPVPQDPPPMGNGYRRAG